MRAPVLSPDMRDIIDLFESHGVEYAVVGGFAVNHYGYVRMTQDLDLLVAPSRENAERVMTALDAFGFGGAGIPQELFEKSGSAIHLGVEPNRIDLLTRLQGLDAATVVAHAERVEIDGLSVRIIAYDHLVAVKRASDRARDHADVDELEKARSAR